ncbi:hypothetical protein Ahy_B01g056120 [Arachis hypogaea]|uniref:Cystatin domain-containing protein n=1 Tax=Arachis hypogaea TaxID=3818 RepID=A0A445AY37_ARAHY|nr:hypothetical protein Ahy_B01g056120 [Arachis hypogaea]
MRRECYVVCLLFGLSITATMASRKEASGGLIAGDLAQFAVTVHNKQSDDPLKLLAVNNGFTQVVSGGINYKIILLAVDGLTKQYQAIVFENHSQNSRKLISFIPYFS